MKVSWWWVVVAAAVAWWWRAQRDQLVALKQTPGYRMAVAQHVDPLATSIPIALPKGAAVAVVPGVSLRPDVTTENNCPDCVS